VEHVQFTKRTWLCIFETKSIFPFLAKLKDPNGSAIQNKNEDFPEQGNANKSYETQSFFKPSNPFPMYLVVTNIKVEW
jgi:hypothetical protein